MTYETDDDRYAEQMQKIAERDDLEVAHAQADELLCEILKAIGGYEKTLAAYESVGKWYA